MDITGKLKIAPHQTDSASAALRARGLLLAAAFALYAIVALVFAQTPLPQFPPFTIFHAGFIFLVDVITSYILFGQFYLHRQRQYAWLGSAYLFSALLLIFFLLTFPGALQPTGIILGGNQSSIWIWHAWHTVFAVLIVLSLRASTAKGANLLPEGSLGCTARRFIALSAALVILVALSVTVLHDDLPPLINTADGKVMPDFLNAAAATILMTLLALVLTWRQVWQRHSVLDLWLAIAMTANFAEVITSELSGARYTFGWYAGRTESMFANCVLLIGFLGEIQQFHRRLATHATTLSIRDSEFRQAQAVAKVGSWHRNFSSNTLLCSEEVCRIFGLPAQAHIDLAVLAEKIHPDDRDRVMAEREESLHSGLPFDVEHRIVIDGETRWVRARAEFQRDAQGKPVSITGTIQDITDRKGLVAKQLDAQNHLAAVIQTIPDLIWMKDRNGVYLTCNPEFELFFGTSEGEIVGKTDYDFVPRELADFFRQKDEEAIAADQVSINEEEIVYRSDGRRVMLETRKVPIHNNAGELLGVLGIGRDITERKQAEAALQRAKEQAEAANRAKSDFLANMSHEIRTPMNAVLGLAQLLQDTTLDARQSDYLTKLNSSARSLLGILNDILDYSKIDAGKLELEAIDFHLDEILDNTASLFAFAAKTKGLELIFDVAPDLPATLTGDPLRFKQVLNNLIGNAIKFTQHGHIRLTLREIMRSGDDITLGIAISDTGIGMSAAEIARLFKPFEQADASTTRKFGGTGLGLVICRRLVELMGGTIAVTSEPGSGSSFSFSLRLKLAATAAKQSHAPDLNQVRDNVRAIRGARILLVEDNPTNQMVAREILGRLGLTVDIACNGQEAVDRVQTHTYDAILMDLQMPVMDGFTATRHIRALAGAGATPIIAMTAAALLTDQQACEAAGMNDFVAKPIEVDKLTTVLLRWIQCPTAANTDTVAATPVPDDDQPFTLPGFALDEAVKRIGDDWSLLRMMLQSSAQDLAQTASTLAEHLHRGEWTHARRQAHTAKGLANAIGAQELHVISRQLEQELMQEQSTSFDEFRNVLTRTLAVLDAA